MSIFGDLFDLNGDGKTDIFEEMIALDMMGAFDDEEDDTDDDCFDSDDER